ncbi:Rrf2 family transcriptional regulator [uncultured Thomasclavelia sp.]|uniref:Rrf2 family transcriptional regulator n=1 Tax=uncultured Thomasclavelia sp. TaxID=3025759 RepID=UPI0025E8BBA2|nr:Rrf2 family transcriptional regulator [uncultured Thomasclavelia sp.]
MQISSRFTIAVHIFACIDTFGKDHKITSDFLADSINVNPVIIRKILSSLKKNNLINVQRGTGGTTIAKELDQINLLDIFRAVDSIDNNQLFHFHENPNTNCPVGKNIHNILDDKLSRVQKAMEDELASITLKEVLDDTRYYVANNQ